MPDGTCELCQKYTVFQSELNRCVDPTCPSDYIVLEDGGCSQCRSGTRPSANRRTCEYTRCSEEAEDNEEIEGRIMICSSLDNCYNAAEGKYNDTLCKDERESCATW